MAPLFVLRCGAKRSSGLWVDASCPGHCTSQPPTDASEDKRHTCLPAAAGPLQHADATMKCLSHVSWRWLCMEERRLTSQILL